MLKEGLTFIKESLRDFRATGAVLPSSHFVARKITSKAVEAVNGSQLRVLEVGSGTGSFSRHLVESLSAGDVLDLCEINPNFAERLRSRFTSNGHHPNGPQIRVYEDSVLNLEPSEPYDFIVSGLPFNSFEPDFVSSVLTKYTEMLKPGGYLSFFEYLFIRELTYPFGSKNYRQRVSAVAEVMSQYYKDRNLESETVLLNIPPAVVHHLSQLNGNGSSGD
ncbi:MAG: methyltransferase domain-containing protein [Planctomycetota bacterium]|jgi:phospholipid N-methyltransferase|nr:methyltransferase domain-containing protein [Planctomycetota bacterium]MDP7252912.1 methyltransferase domain-containing protein [Planctomycetota bacterium]